MKTVSRPLVSKPVSKAAVMAPVMATKAKRPTRPGVVAPPAPPKASKPAETVVAARKPGAPARPVVAAATSKDTTAATSKDTTIVPPPVAKPDAALLARLEGVQKELEATQARLATLIAKKAAKSVTPESVGEGLQIAKDDWRASYQGAVIKLFVGTPVKGGGFTFDENGPSAPCLLTIPRDSMRDGATARKLGMIAILDAQLENGEWGTSRVSYLTQEELGAAWAE